MGLNDWYTVYKCVNGSRCHYWTHSFGRKAKYAKYVTLAAIFFVLLSIHTLIQRSGDAASSQITLDFLLVVFLVIS